MKVSLKVSSKLVASVDHLDLVVIATEVVLCYFIREDIPAKLIFTEILFEFKSKVKSWNPINSPCKLCKTHIEGL